MTHDGRAGTKGAEQLFARLPDDVLESLTPDQRAALWKAASGSTWRRYPVNIRLSLPLPGRRWFVTIVAGAERRDAERIDRERRLYRLRTPGNMLFIGIVGVLGLWLGLAAAIIVAWLLTL